MELMTGTFSANWGERTEKKATPTQTVKIMTIIGQTLDFTGQKTEREVLTFNERIPRCAFQHFNALSEEANENFIRSLFDFLHR